MALSVAPTSPTKKGSKKHKDVKVVCKKIKTMKKPTKLGKSPEKSKKNIGQIAAQSKILDKVWRKSIQALTSESNLTPVHLEMLQKFEGQTVPRKKKKLFVNWVVTSLKLKKEKFLPTIEELYAIIKARSDAEMAKLSAEKSLDIEKKSRRQKLREKKLKKKLKKKLQGEDGMEVALEEEKSKIEFVVPKANVRKRKKKHIREILKEKKQNKLLGKSGESAMEVDGASSAESKHIKFEDGDNVETETDQTAMDESMDFTVSSSKKQKKKKNKSAI